MILAHKTQFDDLEQWRVAFGRRLYALQSVAGYCVYATQAHLITLPRPEAHPVVPPAVPPEAQACPHHQGPHSCAVL